MRRVYTLIMVTLMLYFALVSATEAKRVALLIGNGAYPRNAADNLFDPLDNPTHDADDLSKAFQQYGFTATTVNNASKAQMDQAVKAFIRTLQSGDVGLFYYSGHGVQVENLNYLIPVGQPFSDANDVKYDAVNANWILDKMKATGARVNIMI